MLHNKLMNFTHEGTVAADAKQSNLESTVRSYLKIIRFNY